MDGVLGWSILLRGFYHIPLHVLTAAHCTIGTSPSDWSAVIGEHDTTDHEESEIQTIPVAEILNHPHYEDKDRFTEAADISILTLASPISFSATAAPVCLPASVSPLYTGEVASVAG